MDFFQLYTVGLPLVLQPDVLLMAVGGVFMGITIGALPGLTVTMAVAILVPLTYGLSPLAGILGLIGIYCGGNYGGSVSAILVNVPGTPSAVMTGLDGYPLTLKGQAGRAIGTATIASFIGGFLSVIVLSLVSPVVAKLALGFTSAEFFAIGVLGLSLIAYLGEGSFLKGLISGVIGLVLATVGSDPISGYPRFTFSQADLFEGIPFIIAMIGLFGVTEILVQVEKGDHLKRVNQALKKIIPELKTLLGLLPTVIRSSVIGVIIGAVPGAGGTIASIVSYGQQKRISKNPEKMGKGALEGIAAAEAANNSCTGGAMLTMLSLGIPGDAVTGILIGALMIHGMRPGPILFKENFEMVSAIFVGMFLANICMLVIGLTGAPLFARLISMPKRFLNVAILAFAVIGSYSVRNNFFDIGLMLSFGFGGYLMYKVGLPRTPIVLALILGPFIEDNLRRSLLLVRGDVPMFIHTLVSRPISLFILLFTIFLFIFPLLRRKLKLFQWFQNKDDAK